MLSHPHGRVVHLGADLIGKSDDRFLALLGKCRV
jgi:hypothetical protein